MTINIIGGGLAGCEAAQTIAGYGIDVRLWEMRPEQTTPVHQTGYLHHPQPHRIIHHHLIIHHHRIIHNPTASTTTTPQKTQPHPNNRSTHHPTA
jgi:2-polyprenyl-6-methoxyphenol hydroxylase-like FAD-dependent oxidoreductase